MEMISPPLCRADLSKALNLEGKALSLKIRQMKFDGQLIQRRVSAGPMTKKKKVVFNMTATNLTLEI